MEEQKNIEALKSVLSALGDIHQIMEKSNHTIYQEHFDTIMNDLKDSLEIFFPEKWDIIVQPGTEAGIKKFIDEVNKLTIPIDILNRPYKFMEYLFRSCNYTSNIDKITVIVHFPEINIRNSRGNEHLIRDMYMKFKFSGLFLLLNMYGVRVTKTWQEYNSNYNHSHMPSSAICDKETQLDCCLGNTAYSNLVSFMYGSLDENNFYMLFQQLGDYLSWESLEGGPYISIDNIGDKNYNTRNSNNFSSSVQVQIYQNFIIKYSSGYKIKLIPESIRHRFEVVIDEEFKNKVTSCCPSNILVNYDIITKQTYVENPIIAQRNRIIDMNNNFKNGSPILTFRGEPVYFNIVVPEEQVVEENKNIIKVAPNIVVEAIAMMLNDGINYFYRQFFETEFLNK